MQTVVGKLRWTDKNSSTRLTGKAPTTPVQEDEMSQSGRNYANPPSDEGRPQPQGLGVDSPCIHFPLPLRRKEREPVPPCIKQQRD